ncbi:MAG: hypothetical protein FJW26_07660 [Acidimicrobiia bacterium]|nr:hypothetical protein [Acidimicrobiia bacterium]
MMEKRKHVRISLETEIWLGQDGIFTRTTERLRDLSEGGAFIESREVFAVGSVLSLRFKLPGARELISCSVCVRNLRGRGGMGVEFLDVSSQDRSRIKLVVEEQISRTR